MSSPMISKMEDMEELRVVRGVSELARLYSSWIDLLLSVSSMHVAMASVTWSA